jgi:tRNA pseudouridine38-40 synthase
VTRPKWPSWNWWSDAEPSELQFWVRGGIEGFQGVTRRFWAKVEYDGTDFFGFQIQAQGRTVQGEMERALEEVTRKGTRVTGAGRTDRGVHAEGQVIGFDSDWRHGVSDLRRALNAVLAADVAIVALGLAPEGFHPRFDAISRTYRYTVLNLPERSPLARRTAWQIGQKLDLKQMIRASRCLVGTHDFAAFGRPPQGENTVRTVQGASWQEEWPFLIFDIEANAFLYRMVRSIVGMAALLGAGQISVEGFEALLQDGDRSQIRQVAPAQGLCLMRVDYLTGSAGVRQQGV